MNSIIATLTSKNQLTLPVAVVRSLSLMPGERLWITKEKDRIILEKIGSIKDLQGILADNPLAKKYTAIQMVKLARKMKVARLLKNGA